MNPARPIPTGRGVGGGPPGLALRRLLFPTDGSAWAESAFAQAAFYAARHGAALHVLTVEPGRPGAFVTAPSSARDAFQERLRAAAARAAGFDVVLASATAAMPEDGILDYAARIDADLIVMATRGRRGLARVAMGSVAAAVVRGAPCPVLTACPGAPHGAVQAHRILAPTDLSAASDRVVAHAAALARLHGAALELLHVVEPYLTPGLAGEQGGWSMPPPGALEDAEASLRAVVARLGPVPGGVSCHVEAGHAGLQLLDAAERLDVDLVVMGSHGRTGVRRVLLGSVAERAVQHAPCPVFVVKAFGKTLVPNLS